MESQIIIPSQVDLAKQLLNDLKSDGSDWSASGSDFGHWEDKVLFLIRQIYGIGSKQEEDFDSRKWFAVSSSYLGQDPTYEERLQKEFEKMLPRAEGWMEAFVQDISIGLPSTINVDRKYLWTSPVFWAESTIKWSVFVGLFSWLKLHKLRTVIVTSVSLLAAVLTILSWLGILPSLQLK